MEEASPKSRVSALEQRVGAIYVILSALRETRVIDLLAPLWQNARRVRWNPVFPHTTRFHPPNLGRVKTLRFRENLCWTSLFHPPDGVWAQGVFQQRSQTNFHFKFIIAHLVTSLLLSSVRHWMVSHLFSSPVHPRTTNTSLGKILFSLHMSFHSLTLPRNAGAQF